MPRHGGQHEERAADAPQEPVEPGVQHQEAEAREHGRRHAPPHPRDRNERGRQHEHKRDARARTRPDVQVVRQDARADDQPRPRHGAREHVGAQQRQRRPALQMRHLEVFRKADPVAGPPQSIAELDVLDRRIAEASVESTLVEKHRAPDRAAAAPERRCLFVARLVHVVVQQVPVLREESRVGRGIVVRANHGSEGGASLQMRRHAPDQAGRHDDIGVDEEQHVARGRRRADIAGAGRADRRGELDHLRPGGRGARGRSLAAAVDHDNQLVGRGRAGGQPCQAGAEGVAAVVNGRDDGDSHTSQQASIAAGRDREQGCGTIARLHGGRAA